MKREEELTVSVKPLEWRCFHCDEVFTDEREAGLHFGMDQCSDPVCKIKMGAEKSLVVALRRVEKELSDAWAAIHNESTEAAKAYYAQQSRHSEQLRAAEELGYERGLADGRILPTPNPEAEPVAWESTTSGYIKFVSDERYRKFSPKVRAWYKPYRCSSCVTPEATEGGAHEKGIEAAASAMCEAWHYAKIGTPDGDAEWKRKQGQYRKQAKAAIAAYRAALTAKQTDGREG